MLDNFTVFFAQFKKYKCRVQNFYYSNTNVNEHHGKIVRENNNMFISLLAFITLFGLLYELWPSMFDLSYAHAGFIVV